MYGSGGSLRMSGGTFVCVYAGDLMYVCRTRGSDIDSCLVLPGCEGRALQRTKLRVVRKPYSGVCTPASTTGGAVFEIPDIPMGR